MIYLLTFSVFSDENFFGFFLLPFVDKLLISKHSSFEIPVLGAIFASVEKSHDQISIYSTALDSEANLIMYPKIVIFNSLSWVRALDTAAGPE